jgi:hypothetical protein
LRIALRFTRLGAPIVACPLVQWPVDAVPWEAADAVLPEGVAAAVAIGAKTTPVASTIDPAHKTENRFTAASS